jgi:hypothetical protein
MAAEQQNTIAAQLAALPNLPMAELWALWDQHFPRRPSHRNRNSAPMVPGINSPASSCQP